MPNADGVDTGLGRLQVRLGDRADPPDVLIIGQDRPAPAWQPVPEALANTFRHGFGRLQQ